MFRKEILPAIFFVFTFYFFSCSSEDPGLSNGNTTIPSKGGKAVINIEDALSLVLLNDVNSGGRIAGESTNLYKITTSGSFEKVMFLNDDNTAIDSNKTQTSIEVYKLFDVSKNYIVLQGSFTAWDTLGNTQSYNALLVRKDDGSIYDFNTVDIADGPIFEDGNGNFYYKNNYNVLMQVDVSDPNRLRKSEYLPSGQTAESFGIDIAGNAFYQYAEKKFRIRKKNGGIHEISITEELPGGPPYASYGKYKLQGLWIGINGKIYLETYDFGSNGLKPHFHTVSVSDQGTVSIDTVWTGMWKDNYPTGHGSSTMRRVNKEKSILFVEWNRAWEFFEETNTVNEVNLPQVEFYDDFFYSAAYLYYRFGLTIYKISLADYSYQLITLPQDDQFEIYSMAIDSNETLQLSALRFSDGKKIIAQIDANGIFSIVDQELNKEAIILQRLN